MSDSVTDLNYDKTSLTGPQLIARAEAIMDQAWAEAEKLVDLANAFFEREMGYTSA